MNATRRLLGDASARVEEKGVCFHSDVTIVATEKCMRRAGQEFPTSLSLLPSAGSGACLG